MFHFSTLHFSSKFRENNFSQFFREIKLVFSRNFLQKRLMKAAKEEMARQEVRNKLQQADNEAMEAYRKITAARSKKKPPTKKEREQAWKALKEREIILRQLESI